MASSEKSLADPYEFWLAYVQRFAAVYQWGKQMGGPLKDTEFPAASHSLSSLSRPRIIICAPHPDDEVLTGALCLRLLESGAAVLDLALTLGSDLARKQERKQELAAACDTVGFEWRLAEEPLGFSILNQEAENRPEWQRQVDVLCGHFEQERPEAVLVPHALDGHPSHRAAHQLVRRALQEHAVNKASEVLLVETEYWQSLADPNLLLGVGISEVALLLTALARHRGEVLRHPYHLRQPPRLMDNIRRGSELVKGFGQPAADFTFGELYRVSKIAADGRCQKAAAKAVIPPQEKLDLARLWALFLR